MLCTNANLCGYFSFRGNQYKMVPISNVKMNIITWRKVCYFTSTTTYHAGSNNSKEGYRTDILTHESQKHLSVPERRCTDLPGYLSRPAFLY